jgi:hypothetical protein
MDMYRVSVYFQFESICGNQTSCTCNIDDKLSAFLCVPLIFISNMRELITGVLCCDGVQPSRLCEFVACSRIYNTNRIEKVMFTFHKIDIKTVACNAFSVQSCISHFEYCKFSTKYEEICARMQ